MWRQTSVHQQRRADLWWMCNMPAKHLSPNKSKFKMEACIKPKNVLIILELWRGRGAHMNDSFNPWCNVWKHYINQEKTLQMQPHRRYQSWGVYAVVGGFLVPGSGELNNLMHWTPNKPCEARSGWCSQCPLTGAADHMGGQNHWSSKEADCLVRNCIKNANLGI